MYFAVISKLSFLRLANFKKIRYKSMPTFSYHICNIPLSYPQGSHETHYHSSNLQGKQPVEYMIGSNESIDFKILALILMVIKHR